MIKDNLQAIVDKQAEDEDLWFLIPHTRHEEQLQKALRYLHTEIENRKSEDSICHCCCGDAAKYHLCEAHYREAMEYARKPF